MDFTFESYELLLEKIIYNGYHVVNYHNYKDYDKCVILRHDIDYDLKRAIKFAEIEAKHNMHSTYFVLLTSDLYNVFSNESIEILKYIENLGHEIGLHFDELNYIRETDKWDENYIKQKIETEVKILSTAVNNDIKVISMHRPSKNTLDSNLCFETLKNSYGNEFFKEFKYVSDSRMRWRENVIDIIENESFERLHVLTHPFWYGEKCGDTKEVLHNFICDAAMERYDIMNNNFTNLKEFISINDINGISYKK